MDPDFLLHPHIRDVDTYSRLHANIFHQINGVGVIAHSVASAIDVLMFMVVGKGGVVVVVARVSVIVM